MIVSMPYTNLPPDAFWSRCRRASDFRLADLYKPKFALRPGMRIATAGSCFAQNIGRYVRASDLALVDMEPAPALMPPSVTSRYGYGLFSARYGNVYTARQLLQLLQDAQEAQLHEAAMWEKDGRHFDALRPGTEPEGYDTQTELCAHRRDHLHRVRAMFDQTDVFVFTLGLTETWADRATGTVFPSAPGVIAGTFDPKQHDFVNLGLADTFEDLTSAIALMRSWAPKLKVLLTVSPVPLTATASGHHVLSATTYSKSVLRAVAQEVAATDADFDYMPSYEIITGAPFGAAFFNNNLRTVTPEGVETVMSVFFGAHPDLAPVSAPPVPQRGGDPEKDSADDVICEEAMLEAFADADADTGSQA